MKYLADFTVNEIKEDVELLKLPWRELSNSLILRAYADCERECPQWLLSFAESVTLEDLDDEFMKTGLRLVVDGTDGNVIRGILENEMGQIEARHFSWIGMLNSWAGLAPGFGMMGTVIGLIGMLNNLEDKSSLGPNMAVALITTLYGSMMANWLITPFSTKLANQNAVEMRSKEMIIEGVLAIQAGENPRIMAQKLLTYLDPVSRKAIEADVLKD